MAKVNFGPLANDARGKIAGIVYSKNKSGAYTRTKVTPANPNSPTQTAVRNNFAGLSKAWSGTLTDVQRASWVNYAATYPRIDIFGNAIQLTGLNMFISLNQVLLQLGVATNLTAPASNVVAPIPFIPDALGPNAGTGAIIYNQTAASPGASSQFYVFGAAPQPPGRQPQKNQFRFLEAISGVVGPYPANVDAGPAYAARFGAFLEGQRVSLLVATVDNTTGLTTVGAVLTGLATGA